jgi:hypothetical protein
MDNEQRPSPIKFFSFRLTQPPEEQKKKTSFWASEAETPILDLFYRWREITPTNPPDLNGLMIMNTGKLMELSLLDIMRKEGEIETEQDRIEFEVGGDRPIKVSGYSDAVLKSGEVLEIKTYYGDWQERDLMAGKPRTSYLKQLAIYMYATNAEHGILLYVNRGTGKMFQFYLDRQGVEFYLLNPEAGTSDFIFNLNDTFERWRKMFYENVITNIEPKSEYRYKIPVDEIDWTKVSKTDIAKARNNQKVIGDHPWAIQYSSYKDLIIEREGTELGYTDVELKKINLATKGYSAKAKPLDKVLTKE